MIASVLTSVTSDLLGWTLIHFLWQGTALALALYAFVGFTKRPELRYAAGVVTVGLMLAAPVITFWQLAAKQPMDAVPTKLHVALHSLRVVAGSVVEGSAVAVELPSTAHSVLAVDWLACSVWIWLAGVATFSLRGLGGYLVLRRLIRDRCAPLELQLRKHCRGLEARLGLHRTIRYLESHMVETPAAVGWWKPVVLLPMTALSGLSPEQLEAVIVHELAHIKRWDCLVNLFQIAAETVLFYHPAVWWVNCFVRNEREHCCDDIAVAVAGNPGTYARALAAMEGWRSAPAMAMAANGGALKMRVSRILGLERATSSVPKGGLAMIGCLCVAGVVLGAAQLGKAFALPVEGMRKTQQLPVPPAAPAPAANVKPPLPPTALPAHPPYPANVTTPPPAPQPQRIDPVDSDGKDAPDVDTDTDSEPDDAHGGSYIDGLKSAGIKDLSVDNLIAMKIQGLTPQYVREMKAAGLDASTGELIALKTQGVSADYVKRMRSAGWHDISTGQIIAMKVQDLDPAQAAEFKREFGGEELSLGQLIAFKVQGITPEYVRGLRAAGIKDLSNGQILAAKVQGITPEFIRKVQEHGFKDLSLHQLIGLKMAGVF